MQMSEVFSVIHKQEESYVKKKSSPKPFDFELLSMPVVGVEPTRVIRTRDFESPSSASLRRWLILFALSFNFRIRGGFSHSDQGGFALVYKMIISHSLPPVNHVKLFHPIVLDLRSVRGPELPPRGVCSAQMRSSAASFDKISPDIILGYGVGNRCILFDMKQLSYWKTVWMRLCNSVHTV